MPTVNAEADVKGVPVARALRRQSESGYYHVVARACGKQLLFEDDEDRSAFLEILLRKAEEAGVSIIAWCLMSNHIHLVLLDCEGTLSEVMKVVLATYAQRFNRKTGHVGHVFQDRFMSSPIESDAYLLEAVRYVHENPEKAGICAAEEYRWSSFRDYLDGGGITDTSVVLEMLGGREGFLEFCAGGALSTYRFDVGRRIPDDEMMDVASEVLHGQSPRELGALSVAERNEKLRALRERGLSIRQIERLTGIGSKTISRATSS